MLMRSRVSFLLIALTLAAAFPGMSAYRTGNKLPFFSENYSKNKQDHPPLAVVARRLDGEAGCWEISAHYTPAQGEIQTLTYIIRCGRRTLEIPLPAIDNPISPDTAVHGKLRFPESDRFETRRMLHPVALG